MVSRMPYLGGRQADYLSSDTIGHVGSDDMTLYEDHMFDEEVMIDD